MQAKKFLVFYKKSAYQLYFLERKSSLFGKERLFSRKGIEKFKIAHLRHYETLGKVEGFLRDKGVRYHKSWRGRKIDFSAWDIIVTVGGDGTFLEAARGLRRQIILGVNSDPERSVGLFCSADRRSFPKILERIIFGQAKIRKINRLRIRSRNSSQGINVLNDILVCHKNPAAMSRYYLMIKELKEEQRSSGVWIATAAGSSGAIKSAGAKQLPIDSKEIQYKPRELHQRGHCKYRLKGGIISSEHSIKVMSLMRKGMLFLDGAHFGIPFTLGDVVLISSSSEPLHVVER